MSNLAASPIGLGGEVPLLLGGALGGISGGGSVGRPTFLKIAPDRGGAGQRGDQTQWGWHDFPDLLQLERDYFLIDKE